MAKTNQNTGNKRNQANRRQDNNNTQPLGDKFPGDIITQAFTIAGRKCQCCGKDLVFENRNQRGKRGAWHAHHIVPVSQDSNNDTLENCVILCINGEDCHLNCAHGGNYNGDLSRVQNWGRNHGLRRCWHKNKNGTQCTNMIPAGTGRSYCDKHR